MTSELTQHIKHGIENIPSVDPIILDSNTIKLQIYLV